MITMCERNSLILKVFLTILLIVYAVKCLDNQDCESQGKCSACIQMFDCAWCIQPFTPLKPTNATISHCLPKASLSRYSCPAGLLVNPISKEDIIQEKPLQNTQGKNVQVTPQRIKIAMRLGEERQIHFKYAQSRNYPIDLYYLMDLSASMESHRAKLAELGNKLAQTMTDITSNFRIGFGSFVDKVQLPFVSEVPSKLKSPCTLNTPLGVVLCVPAYSFKNHMSLSVNHTQFSLQVSQGQVSGNLDSPEGGLDALMQAIVCKKEIGWRDNARHLLVLSSDANFHIGGDGRLAGVVEPNDEKCHMNDKTDAFLIYDYPSVSQINYVAKKNNINIMFAIVNTSEQIRESYEGLSQAIENSNVGVLDANSSNVIDLVLDNYKKIVNSVVIDVNAPKNIEVKISSDCAEPLNRGCSGIHQGETVEFTATIKALSCKDYNGQPTIVTLKPEGISETLTIELDVFCSCNCEVPGNPYYIPKAKVCSNVGNLVCGACDCPAGRTGNQCECDGYSHYSTNDTNCIQRPGALPCSGLGTCLCGMCECQTRTNERERITGKYCQCDNYSCNKERGLLCAGRGDCVCGTCQCIAGWTGSACECPNDNSTCMREGHLNDGVCSGRGTCECGKCECSDTLYTGKYCEECPTCRERCKEVKDCVECEVFGTGNLKGGDCDLKCTSYIIEEIESIDENEISKGQKKCRTLDKQDCTILYKYFYDNDKNLIIQVQKTKWCPPNALVWTIIVVGTILLARIIMLTMWKMFTTVNNRSKISRGDKEIEVAEF